MFVGGFMSSLCYLCLFAYSDVQHVVLLLVYVFTISVPCCGVRYDVCIKTMFGLCLPPVVWRKVHVLFMLFVFVCVWWCQIRLDYMSNIAVSYKRKELFTLRKNMVSPPVYVASVLLILLVFCVVFFVCLSRSSSCVLCTQCSQFL